MKRKQFIASLPVLASALSATALPSEPRKQEEKKIREPAFLAPGDLVGITSPAGYISIEEIQPAVAQLTEWGFRVRIGDAIGKRDYSLGGTDEERRKDLQQMLDDPEVNAILCARGGYGSVRIVDALSFDRFLANPKWLIGFSDITVLLAHIYSKCRTAGIHSKMCNSFPENWQEAEELQKLSILSIRDCLIGKFMEYKIDANPFDRPGSGKGKLIGGNLKMLESISGSVSDPNTDGTILFLEDTGEYPYSVDRMFWNLKRSGKLDHLHGLVIGGFKLRADDPGEEFGKTLHDIILEKLEGCRYPVCFGFPVGHQKHNMALKYGVKHQLEVTPAGTVLREIR